MMCGCARGAGLCDLSVRGGPAGHPPGGVGLVVAADEAAGNALAQLRGVARAEPVDIVLPLRVSHGVAGVLELSQALDEAVEVLGQSPIGLNDRKEDVVRLVGEVGDSCS